jgi:hypothetical protein
MKSKEEFESIYPLLNDKHWLEEHYHSLQQNMTKIAEIVGCDEETVRQAMIRQGVSIRSKTEAFKLKNNDDGFSIETIDAFNFFEGLLLGEGRLICNSPSILAAFSKESQHYDLLEYFQRQLFKPGSSNSISKRDRKEDDGTKRTSFTLISLGHECLQKEYDRWYLNKRKIVPQDIVLSPKTLLAWFLSGSTAYSTLRTDGISKTRHIELLTNTFRKEEVEFLQTQLLDKLHIESAICKKGQYLKINSRQICFFLDTIGEICPIPNNEAIANKWIRPDQCRVSQLGPIYK